MRKTPFVLFLALILGTFFGSSAYAGERIRDIRDLDTNRDGTYDECEINPCAEYQCGPCICYCPVTRFKPQYYCVEKCVEEPYTVQKRCCRYVDQEYCKTHCRYVPQYYTKTFCRQVPEYYQKTYCRKVPEYYTVCEQKCRIKKCKEQKCRYVPYTCIERRCIDAPPSGCPSCPSSSSPSDGVQYGQPQYGPGPYGGPGGRYPAGGQYYDRSHNGNYKGPSGDSNGGMMNKQNRQNLKQNAPQNMPQNMPAQQ